MKFKNVVPGLIFLFIVSSSLGADVNIPYRFQFSSENSVMVKTLGGFNFDRDGKLDIIGIAALTGIHGDVLPRTSYLVHFKESANRIMQPVWTYKVNHEAEGDFTDACVSDIDGDGKPEISAVFDAVFIKSSPNPAWLYVFEYDKGFQPQPTATLKKNGKFYTRPRPKYIASSDFLGKGKDVLLVTSGSPMKGVALVQMENGGLDYGFQSYEMDILQGIFPNRSLAANVSGSLRKEIIVLGGKQNLAIDAYSANDLSKAIISKQITELKRGDLDLRQVRACDLNGDGISEILIPLKQGGVYLLWIEGNKIQTLPFLSKAAKIVTYLTADLNRNGRDELILQVKGRPELLKYELEQDGVFNDLKSYSQFMYENKLLKKMSYLDIKPVLTASGEYSGGVILPFRHPDFPAFSLFYWALETPVAAVDMSVVDAVLKEVDQTLEESKVEVKQEEKVEVSTIAIKPEEIKKEPAQPVTPPVLVETKTEDIPTLIMGISTGGMIPFGGNLKDYYDMGLPLSIQIKKPEVAKLGKFSLNLGIETGYYWVKDPTGVKKDLRGAPFYFVGDVDFSSILPGKLCLNAELATGLHMQISDGLFSGTYFGYSPRVSLGYMLGKNTKLFAKVGGTQVFSNKDLGGSAANGGSQEWIDFRLGVDYIFHRTLPDYSVSPDAGLIPSFKLGVFGGPMYPWGGNIDYIYEIGMPVHVQVMFPQVATLKNANVDMGVEFGYYKIAAKLAGRNDLYGVPIYLVGGLDFSSKLPEKLTMGAELAVGLNLQSDEKITNGAFVYASTSPRFTFGYRITDSLELSAKIGGSWIISNFDMGWTTGKSMQDPQEWLDFKLGLSYYFK